MRFNADLLQASRPVLVGFAENITHVGAVGAGHGTKLMHNGLSLGMVKLLAEAEACAPLSDATPEVFVDVLTKGGDGGTALECVKPYLPCGDAGGQRLSIANACKDMGYYDNHGCRCRVAAPVLATLERARAHTAPVIRLPELVRLLAPPPARACGVVSAGVSGRRRPGPCRRRGSDARTRLRP